MAFNTSPIIWRDNSPFHLSLASFSFLKSYNLVCHFFLPCQLKAASYGRYESLITSSISQRMVFISWLVGLNLNILIRLNLVCTPYIPCRSSGEMALNLVSLTLYLMAYLVLIHLFDRDRAQ